MYSTGVLINAIFVAIDCLQREVYSVGRENEVVNAKALFVYAEFLLFMIKTIFVCNFVCGTCTFSFLENSQFTCIFNMYSCMAIIKTSLIISKQ